MGKSRNKERRRVQDARKHNENPQTVLRVVRSENPDVLGEQITSGCASASGDTVFKPNGSNGYDGKEEGGYNVVSAADYRPDDIPEQLVRSFDPVKVNEILNDPSVFPLVSIPGTEKIDASPLIADQQNILLMGSRGGFLFCCKEPGIYEVQPIFLDRDYKHALAYARSAYKIMFTQTDCMTLLFMVPVVNQPILNLCNATSAKKEFERKNIWPTENGNIDVEFRSIRYDDWVYQDLSLLDDGLEFQGKLTTEIMRLGFAPKVETDDCYKIHIGAFYDMMFSGRPEKAIILYNRFARFSGFDMVSVVSASPFLINFGKTLIKIEDNTFKALLYRE